MQAMLLLAAVSAVVVNVRLEVTRGVAAPDCFATSVLLVNGKFTVLVSLSLGTAYYRQCWGCSIRHSRQQY